MVNSENERRRYLRIDSRVVTWYKGNPKEEQTYVETFGALTKNIGAGGILFETDEDLPAGTILNLEMNFPALSRVIKTRGRVVHIEEIEKGRYDVGIMFLDFPETERAVIEKYVDELNAAEDVS